MHDLYTFVRDAAGISKPFSLCCTFPVREYDERKDAALTLKQAGTAAVGCARVLFHGATLLTSPMRPDASDHALSSCLFVLRYRALCCAGLVPTASLVVNLGLKDGAAGAFEHAPWEEEAYVVEAAAPEDAVRQARERRRAERAAERAEREATLKEFQADRAELEDRMQLTSRAAPRTSSATGGDSNGSDEHATDGSRVSGDSPAAEA